ncbi:copper homeostasis protein CutF [Acinetobacter sp. Root1280]|uniref:copper resistance protein NlpE n=1 Tax=Acinetobacter sp. Root1280 TaxID=1736444 RepID=UPI0006FD645B|nr:copper resistance protein NlpE [Acinetobacter sp. Root1280]KQX00157.1 copper homeostasis protein CutF [Acinetobacter sp. Root1280]
MKKTLFVMSILALSLSACSKPTHNASEDIKATAQTQAAASHEAASPTIDSEHNTQNSLDWAGEYKGLLPCADCSGIKTKLVLKSDHTYELTEEYEGVKGEGKEFKTQGHFSFDESGSIIGLDKNADNRKYFVGENILEARSFATGEKIGGPNAELYQLTKDVE